MKDTNTLGRNQLVTKITELERTRDRLVKDRDRDRQSIAQLNESNTLLSKEAAAARAELKGVATSLAKYGYVTDSPAATVDTICEDLESHVARAAKS